MQPIQVKPLQIKQKPNHTTVHIKPKKFCINRGQLTVGLGMHRRGGGAIGSGPVRYDGGEYLPEGKHPGAAIGAPWSPLLPIILSGEYIIIKQSAHLRLYNLLNFRPLIWIVPAATAALLHLPIKTHLCVLQTLNYSSNNRQFLS